MKKLPRTHYEVLSRLAASNDTRLHRIEGGFWVTDPNVEFQEGDWHASTQLVSKLRSMGLISATNGNQSPHALTDKGVQALRQAS